MEDKNKIPFLSIKALKKYVGNVNIVLVATASWCGHCHRLKPVLNDLWGEMLVNKDSRYIIAHFDAHKHANELHDIGKEEYGISFSEVINGYPTIMMMKKEPSNENGIKDAVIFKGDRNLKNMKYSFDKFFKN